jgi:hypothetical protein
MGDDNEIRALIRRESESSLKRALVESTEVAKKYDFEFEFAQTKKNRSFIVLGATLLTIIALGGAAFGVVKIVERQTAAAPVDVRAFEDLNLKDLLDSAKRNENQIDLAKQSLTKLDYDLKSNLDAADRDYAAALNQIRLRNPPDEAAQIQAALAVRDARKRQLQGDYNAAAGKLRAQIAEVQSKIDKYDQRLMDQANKQQAILDNTRRVFEIEKKKQADLYEARIADLEARRKSDLAQLTRQRDELAATLTSRYNPTYADPRSATLLKGPFPRSQLSAVQAFPPYLEQNRFIEAGSGVRLDRSLSDFLYISGKLRAVPYMNSIPPALARMETEAFNSIVSYRAALASAAGGLKTRDDQISQLQEREKVIQATLDRFNWAVSEYVQENREGGYILDPRDLNNISVAINPAVSVADQASGFVVRGDKAIATVVFKVGGGSTTAKMVDLVAGETLKPFDTILVHAAAGSEN